MRRPERFAGTVFPAGIPELGSRGEKLRTIRYICSDVRQADGKNQQDMMDRLPEGSGDKKIAYLFVRLAMAISMLTHGLVRLPKLGAFSDGMVEQFSDFMFPEWLVRPWSYAVPFIEFFLGITLLLGLFTRLSAIAGAVLILILLGGSGMVEGWSAFPSQLIHLAFFVAILLYRRYNSFALDGRTHP